MMNPYSRGLAVRRVSSDDVDLHDLVFGATTAYGTAAVAEDLEATASSQVRRGVLLQAQPWGIEEGLG